MRLLLKNAGTDHNRNQYNKADDLLHRVDGCIKSNGSDDTVIAYKLPQADGGIDCQDGIDISG